MLVFDAYIFYSMRLMGVKQYEDSEGSAVDNDVDHQLDLG
jgi:hypothetical protein